MNNLRILNSRVATTSKEALILWVGARKNEVLESMQPVYREYEVAEQNPLHFNGPKHGRKGEEEDDGEVPPLPNARKANKRSPEDERARVVVAAGREDLPFSVHVPGQRELLV